ncbi:MAG: sigma-70 family RNA polymerase sigma factor [bacterium]|nr:sigma-70 family RNA polymerase sigma factor [bacterium]
MNKEHKVNWETLFEQVQLGNKEVYTVILEKLYCFISIYIEKRIYDKNIIEDLTQEIIITIHNSRHTYNSSRPFLPWVLGIIHYKLIDYFKKNKKMINAQNKFEENRLDNLIYNPVRLFDLKQELQHYLAAVSKREKEILLKVKIQGYSIKETSKLTGLSISNIKTIVHRAIAKIRILKV